MPGNELCTVVANIDLALSPICCCGGLIIHLVEEKCFIKGCRATWHFHLIRHFLLSSLSVSTLWLIFSFKHSQWRKTLNHDYFKSNLLKCVELNIMWAWSLFWISVVINLCHRARSVRLKYQCEIIVLRMRLQQLKKVKVYKGQLHSHIIKWFIAAKNCLNKVVGWYLKVLIHSIQFSFWYLELHLNMQLVMPIMLLSNWHPLYTE